MRVRRGLGLLLLVTIAGVLGYVALGLSVLDAMYQTTTTISTVGFREIGEVDAAFKAFTIVLIVCGVGAALYTLGVLVEELVESELTDNIRRRRMQHKVEKLRDHIVVCGWGQVGQAISAELAEAGRDVVVIDRDLTVEEAKQTWVVGDATEDEVLVRAGVEYAAVLIVAMDSDASNLYVTLTGRSMRADLFIVARASSREAEPKLFRAGADQVVNPHQIGGHHMAALVVEKHVIVE